MIKINNLSLLYITLLVFLSACSQTNTEVVLTGPTMGTEYRITVVSNTRKKSDALESGDENAIQQLEAEVIKAIEAVNQSMSTYIPNSEISRFNQMPSGGSLQLSQIAYEVIHEALKLSKLSEGAFDVTLGKAIRLWGFSEDGRINKKPSQATLLELKESIGHQHLRLDGRTLTKLVDGLEVNLSAIAKGYAVDQAAQVIERLGYGDYLVNIGGELRASGVNVTGQTWKVGVEKPHILGGIAQVVSLNSQAIATSGDYRNFLTIDGEQFSHTIDAQTLEPVYHKLASVSVLSSQASTADALATAILAMGEELGVEFAEQNHIAAYFIIRGETEEDFAIYVTDDFKANLIE